MIFDLDFSRKCVNVDVRRTLVSVRKWLKCYSIRRMRRSNGNADEYWSPVKHRSSDNVRDTILEASTRLHYASNTLYYLCRCCPNNSSEWLLYVYECYSYYVGHELLKSGPKLSLSDLKCIFDLCLTTYFNSCHSKYLWDFRRLKSSRSSPDFLCLSFWNIRPHKTFLLTGTLFD